MRYSVLFIAGLFTLSACTHLSKDFATQEQQIIPLRLPAQESVDWFSASAKQVESAVCRQKLPVTTKEIEAFYSRSFPKPKESSSYELYGITLRNENPSLVLALSKLLTPASDQQKPEKTYTNFKAQFKIPDRCDSALCASKRIFGDNVGPQMIFLMEQYDVNTSPYSWSNTSAFNDSEIADVIRTFELVHPDQFPFESNQQLTKFLRGYTLSLYDNDGSTLANAVIQLFDGWSRQKSSERQYTLYHEIAHNQASKYLNRHDASQAWLDMSGWNKNKSGEFETLKANLKKGHPFTSRYGKTNPAEDFAEAVSAYRLNPALLKSASTQKYELIKSVVYDNIDYSSAKDCNQAHPASEKIKKDALKVADLPKDDFEFVVKACTFSYFNALFVQAPNSFFEGCVNYETAMLWYQKNNFKYPNVVPNSFFDPILKTSNIKFPLIVKKAKAQLHETATKWIMKETGSLASDLNDTMTNDEYCGRWASLSQRYFPIEVTYRRDAWEQASYYKSSWKPSSAGAVGLCMSLVKGYIPSAKAPVSSVKNWLSETIGISTNAPLSNRGVTERTVSEYITNRLGQ